MTYQAKLSQRDKSQQLSQPKVKLQTTLEFKKNLKIIFKKHSNNPTNNIKIIKRNSYTSTSMHHELSLEKEP